MFNDLASEQMKHNTPAMAFFYERKSFAVAETNGTREIEQQLRVCPRGGVTVGEQNNTNGIFATSSHVGRNKMSNHIQDGFLATWNYVERFVFFLL